MTNLSETGPTFRKAVGRLAAGCLFSLTAAWADVVPDPVHVKPMDKLYAGIGLGVAVGMVIIILLLLRKKR